MRQIYVKFVIVIPGMNQQIEQVRKISIPNPICILL